MRGEEIAYLGRNDRGEEGIHFVSIFGYPSDEPLISERPQRVDRILLRPRSMRSFVGGMFWIDALNERGHCVQELILPFVPGARQDRLNREGDYLFTAKSVAKMVNDRLIPKVTILDPHSEVIAGMIDGCRSVHPFEFFRAERPYAAVISPDAGAEKRAGQVAKSLGTPLFHGWKSRDVATGAITGFGLEPGLPPERVLVVDDICDGGGTFVGLADVIERVGAIPDLLVTHGLFTQGTGKLLARYRRVYCSDSVALDRPGISVIEVCQRLIEGRDVR